MKIIIRFAGWILMYALFDLSGSYIGIFENPIQALTQMSGVIIVVAAYQISERLT